MYKTNSEEELIIYCRIFYHYEAYWSLVGFDYLSFTFDEK